MFWSTWWNCSSARFSCEPFVVFSFACLNWKQNGIIWKTQKQHKKMWTIFQCCVNLCSRRRPASPSARQPCALAFFFHVCSCVAATATVARMECRCTVDFVATIWKYIVELMARAHCSLAAGFMFILYSAPFSFSCALSLWRRRTKKTSKVIIVVVLHDRD